MARRDGKSASEIIRIWIEGYVRRKDPSNPQRPLTVYDPSHEDAKIAKGNGVYSEILSYAKKHRGEVNKKMLFQFLEVIESPKLRIAKSKDIIERLKDDGVTLVE